jgi:hypothetical protein
MVKVTSALVDVDDAGRPGINRMEDPPTAEKFLALLP